jgi:ribosomal protein L23
MISHPLSFDRFKTFQVSTAFTTIRSEFEILPQGAVPDVSRYSRRRHFRKSMKSTKKIFYRRIQTEKSMKIPRSLIFEVDYRARKPELRRVFAEMFGFYPLRCNTLHHKNKKIARFLLSERDAENLEKISGSQEGPKSAQSSEVSKISKAFADEEDN